MIPSFRNAAGLCVHWKLARVLLFQAQMLALLTLGEIGWQIDLPSSHPGLLAVVESLFGSPSEDVKLAAAVALGGICVGNMAAGLPVLLGYLSSGGTNSYLLLTSLKVSALDLCCQLVHVFHIMR